MYRFAVLLCLGLLAACGPKPRSSKPYDPIASGAKAVGVSQQEYRNLVAADKARLQNEDTATLRDRTRQGCANLRGQTGYKECVVRQRASVVLITERQDKLIASNPTEACIDTRVGMGQSRQKAGQVCGGFSRACQAEYARRYWRHADIVTVGLLGAEGKGYFKCKAAEETLFAGKVTRTASFDSLFSDRTIMSADPCHNEQIEYYAPDGKAYLWYGTNKNVVVGEWEIVTERSDPRWRTAIASGTQNGKPVPVYCQRYQSNTYNPVTKKTGGQWQCLAIFLTIQGKADSAAGDVFGLAQGQSVPGPLRDNVPTAFQDYANPYPGAQCKGSRVVRGS